MGAFLSVAKGSVEVPWLLEVRYRWQEGGEDAPLVLVGKGRNPPTQVFEDILVRCVCVLADSTESWLALRPYSHRHNLPAGVTFDTGGISIKPAAGMGAMRADMGGAACVAAALMGIAQQQVETR